MDKDLINKHPIISVIIPCYNSGSYIVEAVNSVLDNIEISSYEIIIVDDGSSDIITLQTLVDLKTSTQFIILYQENKGPASARNAGIKESKGNFLLFLDSDNKIRKTYVKKALDILVKNDSVGVVYANPFLFGEVSDERVYNSQSFDLAELLSGNYIDMCSIVRKQALQEVGGFDENMRGLEDWELWIRIAKAGWKFYYLDEALFEYRITNSSLTNTVNKTFSINSNYVYVKHIDLFSTIYKELYYKSKFYDDDVRKPFKSFFKYVYKNYKKK